LLYIGLLSGVPGLRGNFSRPWRFAPLYGLLLRELNLTATRRLGEISAALEKAKVRGNQHTADVRVSDNGKTATLSSVGISRQRANEAEKLARH
jgi:hypothetical protein